MTVRIKDIAERAGLSMPTVSHVLGSRGDRYPAETRAKVLAAAQELGYRPNGSAQAMRSGRFGCIALLLSNQPHRSNLFMPLLDGIHDALEQQDLHLTLAKLPDEKLTDPKFFPKFLRQWMADGMLVNYTHDIPERFLPLIAQNNFPLVWLNSQHEHDAVYPDDFAAGQQATEYLLHLGHRRITYADYPHSTHYSTADRYAGYKAAMHEAGLSPVRLCSSEPASPTDVVTQANPLHTHRFTLQWAVDCANYLLRPQRPTALIGYGDTASETLLSAALALGLRVPEDLSLVTFGHETAVHTGRPITTWLVPEYAIGQAGVEMLLTKVEEPTRPLPTQVLPFIFDPGVTSAPTRT